MSKNRVKNIIVDPQCEYYAARSKKEVDLHALT